MQKFILFFIISLYFIFSDVLLDRMETKPYNICPISKKHRKNFFLLEIRQLENNTVIYIFKKEKKNYKFLYGFNLRFLGKEGYFQGYIDGKSKKFKKRYLYYCKPNTIYLGNFVVLVGGKISKKNINIYFKDKKIKIQKKNFYAKEQVLLFIPEKNQKAFFTTRSPKGIPYKKSNWLPNKNEFIKGHLTTRGDSGFHSLMLWLSAYKKKIIGLTSEQRKFRDKYFISLSDLQKQGIAEPTPMWDAKVKPYKNVFGEELLD